MAQAASHQVPVTISGPDAPVVTEEKKVVIAPEVKPEVKTEQPTDQKTERPTWLPEKFKSAEDLAKAYVELEKAKSASEKKDEVKPTDEKKEPTAEEKAAEDKLKEDAEKAKTPELPKHLEKFNAEFAEKGELSAESYTELAEKHGLSKDYVDTFIQGVQAKQAAYFKAVYDEVGGTEEKFNEVSAWATANVPKAELEAINEALASHNPTKAALATRGLYAKFQEANGKEPNLLGGGNEGADSNITKFASLAQVTEAMRDPRYAKDPAYRAVVEKRLAISDVI